jgi:hypothetical protein
MVSEWSPDRNRPFTPVAYGEGMPGYVLRIRLPDRPGALGLVASRIGSVGVDIVAIDILNRSDGSAVDEFEVELTSPDLVDLLRSEIHEVDGVTVEEIRPVAGADVTGGADDL